MIQQLDAPTFSFVIQDDDLPQNSRTATIRREETRMETLAYEIVRYMPEIAEKLVGSGRQRLLAA